MELKPRRGASMPSRVSGLYRTFYGIETFGVGECRCGREVLIVPFMELKHLSKTASLPTAGLNRTFYGIETRSRPAVNACRRLS